MPLGIQWKHYMWPLAASCCPWAPLSSIRSIHSHAGNSFVAQISAGPAESGFVKGCHSCVSGIQGLETLGFLFTICFHGSFLIALSSSRILGSLIKTVWLVVGGRKSQIVEEMVTFLALFYVYLRDKHTNECVCAYVCRLSLWVYFLMWDARWCISLQWLRWTFKPVGGTLYLLIWSTASSVQGTSFLNVSR